MARLLGPEQGGKGGRIVNTEKGRHLLADRNLRVICGVTVISVLGIASVTPAFPAAAKALSVSSQEMALLISAFTLPSIIFTPLTGILADRIGRRQILLPSLLLFGLGGVACAFAPSFPLLVFCRFVQGLGASSLSSLNMVLIGDLFQDDERESATGYNSSAVSLGTALFPVLGGALAMLSWRAPFLIAALAFPVAYAVAAHLKAPFAKGTATMGGYFKALGSGLRQREIVAILTATAGTFIVLFGSVTTYLPFLLAERFGASSFSIGLVFLCQSLATALTASSSGFLAERFGPRSRLCLAFCLFSLALVIYPRAGSLPPVILAALLFGTAQGLNMPVLLSLLVTFACPEYRGGLMAVNTLVLRLGQTVGPLLAGFVLLERGIDGVFNAAALTALVTVALVLALFGKSSLTGRC